MDFKKESFVIKVFISLIILLSFVGVANAGIQRITITDMTGDFNERITIYQNDNMSTRYVNSANLSNTDPFNIPSNHGIVIYFSPKYKSVTRELTGEGFTEFIFRMLPYFIGLLVALSMAVYVYGTFKYKRFR
jgi:hypothetical protein